MILSNEILKDEMVKLKKKSFLKRIPAILGVILCIILIPVLVMNMTIIIKSYLDPDKVPDFFGIKPFIVISGSMEGTVNVGDLVITKTVDPATLKAGDIISFSEGSTVITHRIVELTENNGEPAFITKGDANDSEDPQAVTYSNVESIFMFRIPYIGNLAMQLQTPMGIIILVGSILFLFIIYSFTRHMTDKKAKGKREAESRAEIEMLRARLEDMGNGAQMAELGAKG